MPDPYRTLSARGRYWFVDSDGDIIRMDCVQAVYPKGSGVRLTHTVLMLDGSKIFITENDANKLKEELLR